MGYLYDSNPDLLGYNVRSFGLPKKLPDSKTGIPPKCHRMTNLRFVVHIENASAFAPYLGMIIFKIWRIGVSIRHHFTRNHQTMMKMAMKMKCCTQLTYLYSNIYNKQTLVVL